MKSILINLILIASFVSTNSFAKVVELHPSMVGCGIVRDKINQDIFKEAYITEAGFRLRTYGVSSSVNLLALQTECQMWLEEARVRNLTIIMDTDTLAADSNGFLCLQQYGDFSAGKVCKSSFVIGFNFGFKNNQGWI